MILAMAQYIYVYTCDNFSKTEKVEWTRVPVWNEGIAAEIEDINSKRTITHLDLRGLTKIPEMAFRNCGGLTEVILGMTLTDIGRFAFFRSKNFKQDFRIEFAQAIYDHNDPQIRCEKPDHHPLWRIGQCAFSNSMRVNLAKHSSFFRRWLLLAGRENPGYDINGFWAEGDETQRRLPQAGGGAPPVSDVSGVSEVAGDPEVAVTIEKSSAEGLAQKLIEDAKYAKATGNYIDLSDDDAASPSGSHAASHSPPLEQIEDVEEQVSDMGSEASAANRPAKKPKIIVIKDTCV